MAVFEAAAELGYVTCNRLRVWGSANGFFPVLTVAQLMYVSCHGGYKRLLTLSPDDAEQILEEATTAHNKWIGAEPALTQAAAEAAFINTKSAKDQSDNARVLYAAGRPHVPRPRDDPQQEGEAESRRIAVAGKRIKDLLS